MTRIRDITQGRPLRAALTALTALAALAAPVCAAAAAAPPATPDSTLTLSGDAEGTVFRSLTVEGENRVRISFERPELAVDLDPAAAPGLSWGDAMDVLNRTVPDLTGPLLAQSASLRSPYAPRAWLAAYRTGPVATFTFDLKDVARWQLQVADSRGEEVAQFTGEKNPPRAIDWDGRRADGSLALPGLTYSYVLEAFDKAGNRRRFVGEGFGIEAYRRDGEDGASFLVSGAQWQAADRATGGASALALEAAGAIVQGQRADAPVTVVASAGTYRDAQVLGDGVADELRALLPGPDARVAVSTRVAKGMPEGGIIEIRTGGVAASAE